MVAAANTAKGESAGLYLTVFASPFFGAAESLALEQALLAQGGCWFFLRRNRPCVSVGQNQDLDAEVDVNLARKLDIDIVRRHTGGGAVFRDEGCVSYSFIVPCALRGDVVDAVVSALKQLGANVRQTGRNDLFLGERKVSGYAWTQRESRVLVHGTLLFESDIELMDRLLGRGKAKYVGTAVQSVASRVGNLCDTLPGMTVQEFQDALQKAILDQITARGWMWRFGILDDAVLAQAQADASAYSVGR